MLFDLFHSNVLIWACTGWSVFSSILSIAKPEAASMSVVQKSCSEKLHKIHGKKRLLESLFNKVADSGRQLLMLNLLTLFQKAGSLKYPTSWLYLQTHFIDRLYFDLFVTFSRPLLQSWAKYLRQTLVFM